MGVAVEYCALHTMRPAVKKEAISSFSIIYKDSIETITVDVPTYGFGKLIIIAAAI